MFRIASYISLLILLFCGCDKKEGSIYDCVLSPEFLEGGYRKINVSKNGLEILYDDQYFPPCKRDDLLVIFSTNTSDSGVYNIVEGSSYCTPSTYEEGSWILQGDTLIMNYVPYLVKDFSCIGFKTEYRTPDPMNPTEEIVVITTYSKVR